MTSCFSCCQDKILDRKVQGRGHSFGSWLQSIVVYSVRVCEKSCMQDDAASPPALVEQEAGVGLETGPGFPTQRPAPSGRHLLARYHVPEVLQPAQTTPSPGDQALKTWACEEYFTFKPWHCEQGILVSSAGFYASLFYSEKDPQLVGL